MEKENFENTLRTFIRSEPFRPFVVDLDNGEQVLVVQRSVAFNNGFAGYISPDYDLIEFHCDNVRDIRPLVKERV